MLRSNRQWVRQGAMLAAGGIVVFGGLVLLKNDPAPGTSSQNGGGPAV